MSTSKFTIDGEVYEASAKESLYDGTYSVTKDVDFYIDTYGYLIKIDAADSSVDVANMALVMSAAADRSAGWAKLAFSDATAKEVDTDANYGALKADGSANSFVFDTNDDTTRTHMLLATSSPTRSTRTVLMS